MLGRCVTLNSEIVSGVVFDDNNPIADNKKLYNTENVNVVSKNGTTATDTHSSLS